MAVLSVSPAYPVFFGLDASPIENGKIWIGAVNLNPVTNQIAVYWDAAMTIPAAQPIRTVAGYPSYNGKPAQIYVNSDYSILVQDKKGNNVYNSPSATARFSNVIISGTIDASKVDYTAPFTGAVNQTLDDRLSQIVNVKDFGALGDGSTDDTAAIQLALDATPENGILYFPAGVYRGYILAWRGDFTIKGDGSACTILKLPDNCPNITVPHDGVPNPLTGLPNVIEIGECALGNAANTYERVNIIGLTVDGNYANNSQPAFDLFGHGIILTKTSKCVIYDVVAQNCHLTGIDNVINSNYNQISAQTINCGNALISGGHYPNFDVNSSKYCAFNIISYGGYYGARVLDNCFGNNVTVSVNNPSITGFVYDNQSVNESYGNIINVSVVDGCTNGQGVSVGSNCKNSQINATIYGVGDIGFFVNGAAATPASGNHFKVNTQQCGSSGVYLGQYCKYNKLDAVSKEDGRNGAPGDSFAIDVDGADNNQISAVIQEGSVSQVRGIVFRSGAENNRVLDLIFDPNLVQSINDLGTGNYINIPSGYTGTAIASANTITIPFAGSLFDISGNTGIVTIDNSSVYDGRIITLRFLSNPIVSQKSATPGSNIILSGSVDFNATANDTLMLISDGTDWIEVSRTVI